MTNVLIGILGIGIFFLLYLSGKLFNTAIKYRQRELLKEHVGKMEWLSKDNIIRNITVLSDAHLCNVERFQRRKLRSVERKLCNISMEMEKRQLIPLNETEVDDTTTEYDNLDQLGWFQRGNK